ncbi:MAG: hypothetical protein K0R99_2567, partial [Microbacterium sp.]|nr:hypothetical protein [Microbacterium sp.]
VDTRHRADYDQLFNVKRFADP